MKLWIIGKKGILASAMQRKCEEKGIDYIASSRKEVDLCQKKKVEAQFDSLAFTHVVNCAAYTAVDRAEEEEEKAYALNADAIEILARQASAYKKKLIHFSTDYVFDGKKKRYGENATTSPLSVYGKSKRAGEILLKKYCPHACLIRTSWLFGREGTHFVKTMIRMMQEKQVIEVVNDQWGRPTYADDLAESALTLLDASGTYHFANEGETTWYAFARFIKQRLEALGLPLKCQQIRPIMTKDFAALAKRPSSSILETKHFVSVHWKERVEEVICHAL